MLRKYRKTRELISSENLSLEEYSEALVYRIIERITAVSYTHLTVKSKLLVVCIALLQRPITNLLF